MYGVLDYLRKTKTLSCTTAVFNIGRAEPEGAVEATQGAVEARTMLGNHCACPILGFLKNVYFIYYFNCLLYSFIV